jgi:hypothetical protein
MADFEPNDEFHDFRFAPRLVTRNDTGEPFVSILWRAPGDVILDESTP